MIAADDRIVTVFGGTGFLGHRVVRRLRSNEFRVRVASRNPDRAYRWFAFDDPQVQLIHADIQHERSVADALACAYGAVNAVSLYVMNLLITGVHDRGRAGQAVSIRAPHGQRRSAP